VQLEDAAPSWRGERWTSIIMLAWGREREFLADQLPRLRCGPAPDRLRPCRADDAAVRMQGPSCIRNVRQHVAMQRVLQRSNCRQPTPSWGLNESQRASWADEVAEYSISL